MKVLNINNNHHIRGGADRVYFNTFKLLEKYGIEVIHFSSIHPLNDESEFSDYFVRNIDFRKSSLTQKVIGTKDYIYNHRASKSLEYLISKHSPDIAHLHLFYGGLSGSILKVLKENHIPTVMSIHDYRLLCPANAFLDSKNVICEKCINKSYYQCTLNRCLDGNLFYSAILSLEAYSRKYMINPLNYIDHFIFVSKFSQWKHIQFDDRYENKSSHLYNFNPEEYSPSNSIKGKYFLYFGRLSKEKGIGTLIAAAIKSNIELKIVGSGPLQSDVEAYSKKHPKIEYLGHKDSKELHTVLGNASFIIVPSEWYENNPMTIIEAYSHNKPVIGANIGGIPEILVENQTGYLFESRNVEDLTTKILIAQNISDEGYKQLSKNAGEFSRNNFSAEVHYRKLLDIYKKLINNV